MENVVKRVGGDDSAWSGTSVFLTGHTGFKGAWLSLWLEMLGARVHGFSLDPPTQPNLFDVAGVAKGLASDTRKDLADLAGLTRALREAEPRVIFHLAAQSLVRPSYQDPLGTYRDNVMGTAHVLQAAREVSSVAAIVIITTDKVYENQESARAYRETDPLGGHDPYSASKAAAEIVTASFRSSFFGEAGHSARVATARAGNVIGGGDWALDRLVPDCLRAFDEGQPVRLRNPDSVRPWQHVLEPLDGYRILAEALLEDRAPDFPSAWNFGPDAADDETVGFVARQLAGEWGTHADVICETDPDAPHEAGQLRLDSQRAHSRLNWHPRWSVSDAVRHTALWHRAWLAGAEMREVCRSQIDAYASTKSNRSTSEEA